MAVERLTKRTIYIASCPTCGEKEVRELNPPREIQCKCGTWVPFEATSYTGPDTFDKK